MSVLIFLFWLIVWFIFWCNEEPKKKKKTPPKPTVHVGAGYEFDWDEYYQDIKDGMSPMEQLEKKQRLEYWKPGPLKNECLRRDRVADVEAYERDKRERGEEFAEMMRKSGFYRYKNR